jgi:putative sugar O-methyltransferase
MKPMAVILGADRASRRETILGARQAIARMRAADTRPVTQASAMWQDNVDAFRYLLDGDDLTPFETLRQHTHHITADPGRKLDWFVYQHSSVIRRLADRLEGNLVERVVARGDSRRARAHHFGRWLRAARLPSVVLDAVVEPPSLGGGEIPSSVVNGRPYNFETARFLFVIANVLDWGALSLDRPGLRILDLGSGWGGLAYFLRRIFPSSHLTLVDLPETFIFSMPYLIFTDPDKTFYVPSDGIGNPAAAGTADYAFYSPAILERFADRTFDLIVNTGSMAEMTEAQVAYYIGQIKRIGKGAFYSLNEDRQSRNDELRNLTGMLEREFRIVPGRHWHSVFRSRACTW